MTHTQLKAKIQVWAYKRYPKIQLFNNPSGVSRTATGSILRFGVPPQGGGADMIGIIKHRGRGIFIAVEVKVGRDILRENQIVFREAIKRCGGIWLRAKSCCGTCDKCGTKGFYFLRY